MLPVTVEHHADESIMGFASRVAIANGFPSIYMFLEALDIPIAHLEAGREEAISDFVARTGATVPPLRKLSTFGRGKTWRIGDAEFDKEMRPGKLLRFCAACVKGDIEREGGRSLARPYRRAAWETKAVSNCPEHRTALTEIASGANRHDFSRAVWGAAPAVGVSTEIQPCACDLDRYVMGRMVGTGNGTFLDALEVYIVVELSRYLGQFLRRHGWRPTQSEHETASMTDRELGFSLACGGESRIEAAVVSVIATVKPAYREARDLFGELVRWLRRNHRKSEFSDLVLLFQGIAERNLPIGPSDQFIVPVAKRYIHSVSSASKEYGLPESRVLDLVMGAGLVGKARTGRARVCFDAEEAHPLLEDAAAHMTSVEAAAQIGIIEERLRQILEDGLLPRAEEKSDASRVFTRVRRADVAIFVDRILGGGELLIEGHAGVWLSLEEASQTCHVPFRDIVRLLFNDGRLKRAWRTENPGLRRLLVDREEIIDAVSGERLASQNHLPSYLDMAGLRRRLETTSGTVSELTTRNLIPIRHRLHPVKGTSYMTVDLAEVQKFEARYVSLFALARKGRRQIAALRAELEKARIKPLFPTTGKIARYYRIRDLKKSERFRHLL